MSVNMCLLGDSHRIIALASTQSTGTERQPGVVRALDQQVLRTLRHKDWEQEKFNYAITRIPSQALIAVLKEKQTLLRR